MIFWLIRTMYILHLYLVLVEASVVGLFCIFQAMINS